MRVRRLLFLPTCFIQLLSCAQSDGLLSAPAVQRYFHQLGNKKIAVRHTTFAPASPVFVIQLHDDENTAEEAATAFLQQHGGTLLSLENKDNRYLSFSLHQKSYLFDPNRIFTAQGVRQNLSFLKAHTTAAATAVASFSRFLLRFVPDSAVVVAVHNNTDGRYSINSYNSGALKQDAAAVHMNRMQDGDDFFITTNQALYEKLAAAGYNCVLQNNKAVRDDGSLSFYFRRRVLPYINIEAQRGHRVQQLEMLHVLHQALAP